MDLKKSHHYSGKIFEARFLRKEVLVTRNKKYFVKKIDKMHDNIPVHAAAGNPAAASMAGFDGNPEAALAAA